MGGRSLDSTWKRLYKEEKQEQEMENVNGRGNANLSAMRNLNFLGFFDSRETQTAPREQFRAILHEEIGSVCGKKIRYDWMSKDHSFRVDFIDKVNIDRTRSENVHTIIKSYTICSWESHEQYMQNTTDKDTNAFIVSRRQIPACPMPLDRRRFVAQQHEC